MALALTLLAALVDVKATLQPRQLRPSFRRQLGAALHHPDSAPPARLHTVLRHQQWEEPVLITFLHGSVLKVLLSPRRRLCTPQRVHKASRPYLPATVRRPQMPSVPHLLPTVLRARSSHLQVRFTRLHRQCSAEVALKRPLRRPPAPRLLHRRILLRLPASRLSVHCTARRRQPQVATRLRQSGLLRLQATLPRLQSSNNFQDDHLLQCTTKNKILFQFAIVFSLRLIINGVLLSLGGPITNIWVASSISARHLHRRYIFGSWFCSFFFLLFVSQKRKDRFSVDLILDSMRCLRLF